MENAATQRWNLADTIKLSRKPIKCGISVMAGYNAANDLVCIIDVDNNGDFGDDVLRPVTMNSFMVDPEVAVPVYTEYVEEKVIKNEKLRVLLKSDKRRSDGEKIELMFSFPEFRYVKFNYQGQPFFIITETEVSKSTIWIMPDVPNFTSAPNGRGIKLDQLVSIGDTDFRFSGYADNGNKITLTGDDLSGFSTSATANSKIAAKPHSSTKNKNIFSSQAGFLAPHIKGVNINPLAKDIAMLSTADLKGKYVFVDFWSTSCAPCIAEFPNLKAAYERFDRSKFEIVGVLDERDESITKRLINNRSMIWPTIKTNTKGTDITGYSVNSYPTSYLIDPAGKIIALDLRGEDLMNKLSALIKL
ncbi:TlpA family protein disulfide reductase [Mucilaginibacter antarcticus]